MLVKALVLCSQDLVEKQPQGERYTVECPNEGHTLWDRLLFILRRLSSLGGPKCIRTIRRNILGAQAMSFVERMSLFGGPLSPAV